MSEPQTILVVGGCGSGKTWCMRQLLKTLKTKAVRIGMLQFRYDAERRIAIMGVYDGSAFEGSDRLNMRAMNDLEELRRAQNALGFTIIAEGDRFTNRKFVSQMKPYVIKISDTGERGRLERGSQQTERHIKAIATRVSNICANVAVQNSAMALEIITQRAL
jgi:hypothetical protein